MNSIKLKLLIFLLFLLNSCAIKRDKKDDIYFVFRFYDHTTKQQIKNTEMSFYKIKYNGISNKTILKPVKVSLKTNENGFVRLKYGKKIYGETFGDQKYRIVSYNSDKPSLFSVKKEGYRTDTLVCKFLFKDYYKDLKTSIISDSIFLYKHTDEGNKKEKLLIYKT
ncbi:MAG: hypothetical protein ACK5MZ_03380 [Aestuariibaculum sp.]